VVSMVFNEEIITTKDKMLRTHLEVT